MTLTGFTPTTDPNAPIFLGNPTGISAYADQQTDAANTYLLRLGDATAGLAPPVITPVFPETGLPPSLENPSPPTVTYPVWTSPSQPTAFSGSVSVDDILPEPFDDAPPVLNFGPAPAEFSLVVPDAPGVNTTFEDPTLSVTLPAPPSLLSINVRAFDGLNLPTFDAEEPVLDLVEPTIREYTPGADYTSDLLTSMQTALQDWIENGGTGLSAEAENAIWERGREREARSKRDAILALEQIEELGYALPPGVYTDARIKIITETDYVDRGHSREVMIKSAELQVENVRQALQNSVQLESRLIDYSNSVEQRLFEATRYATEAGVQIYNSKVQAYAALTDVYRAKVQAYEAQIRSETARVEAYRAEVQAEEAKARVNTALVEQYKVQADIALANIRIYEAEIQGIQTKAQIEKLKVDIYGEQVRAYGAQVNAYTAGIEGYRARLQAETAKQQAFQSSVEAYRAQVEAAGRVADVRIANLRAQIESKGQEWDGYRAVIQGEGERVRSLTAINSAVADIYRAEVQGASAFNDSLTKQWQAVLDQNQRTAEIGIQAAKANSDLYVTVRSLALDAAKVGAQVSSQLGAAALNAINWSTSFSNSNSYGTSWSYSDSRSDSSSDSRSYNENYNYSV